MASPPVSYSPAYGYRISWNGGTVTAETRAGAHRFLADGPPQLGYLRAQEILEALELEQ